MDKLEDRLMDKLMEIDRLEDTQMDNLFASLKL